MFVDKISSKCTCTDTSQFRQLDMEELPEGISSGISYTSVCINTPQYLHYLLGKCVAAGVVVKRSILHDISDARGLHASGRVATIVVNCTGLGAATLLGVQDSAVYPARGHVVLLRNDTAGRITFVSGTDDGPEETIISCRDLLEAELLLAAVTKRTRPQRMQTPPWESGFSNEPSSWCQLWQMAKGEWD
jgi:glycine/D-amino acid oxidase-like deaminating enzyme